MSFAKSLLTVSGFTILSRIAGFVRDSLTALFLGAGLEADAFFVAQRLPNLFRSLFAEGAFTAAFVPIYSAQAEKEGVTKAQDFAGRALALLGAFLTPFSLFVIIFMPFVIRIMAPGFEDEAEKFNLAVSYSRITFPYLLLISVTALQGGVLNAHGRFGPAAFAPVALNLVLISALFLTQIFNWPVGTTLAWATTLSGVVQAAWLAISCKRAKLSIPLLFPRLTPATQKLFQQIGPGALGAGAAQINLLLSTILASLLPTGAVSYLYYADRLNQLPLGIVGIAVATTLLPLLSKKVAAGDRDAVCHYTSRAIEFCLILGLPATAGLMFAGLPIIQTLFQHGAFSANDALQTSKALMAYALGVPAFLLVKVFAAQFFAAHNTKTPVKIAFISLSVNIGCSILFFGFLEHVGMALATAIATWVNTLLLLRSLRRSGTPLFDKTLTRRIPQILTAAAVMAGSTYTLNQLFTPYFIETPLSHKILGLTAIIGLSTIIYIVLLFAFGFFKMSDIQRILKKEKTNKT